MQKIVLNNILDIQSQFVLLSSFSDITAWAKDSEGRFVAVNQTFLNRYGMSRQSEIEGKDDYDLHPKSHADQYRAFDPWEARVLFQFPVHQGSADGAFDRFRRRRVDARPVSQ